MQVTVTITDTLTGETGHEEHEIAEATSEELRQIIVRENQEQVGEDQYTGDEVSVIAGGVNNGTVWAVLHHEAQGSYAPWMTFMHANVPR